MDVIMTACAGELIEVVQRYFCTGGRLVTPVAGHCFVPSGEGETGLLVFRQRVTGCLPGCPRMALLTSIAPWSSDKLALMLIFVAIHTKRKLDFESGILAGRNMACGALYLGVWKHDWVSGLRVVRYRECGRTPPLDRMATFASPSVRSLQELPAVWIRLVAVRTLFVGNRRLEICTLMARLARYFEMLAQKRIVRL